MLRAEPDRDGLGLKRSEEHTSELQSRGLISYAVFCLKKKKIANEGDNTPAPARGVIDVYKPRKLLDVGTWGVMGIGFFYKDAATTEIYTLSLPDAVPI